MNKDFEINHVDFPSEKNAHLPHPQKNSEPKTNEKLPNVKIVPRKIISGNLVNIPDGRKPVPLGSGNVTSIIGEGGVAIVYEIWNERLGISRAVKLLRPNHSSEARNRFETEMKILAQLRHPNIIEIHAVGEWNGLPYIEMERVQGSSLSQMLKARGAVPVEVCCAIAIMICRSLIFTHTKKYKMNGKDFLGILHRDLKPGNVMISDNGGVKLMDFGIATPTHVSMHTVEGTVVGSLNYMAPEQISERDMDARTDIYALGCVLYEMLTAKKAFPQKTIAELIPKKMKGNYIPLSYYHLKIPKKLNNLIVRCIDAKKEKRYDSSADVLKDLEKIYKHLTPTPAEETLEFFLKNSTVKKVTLRYRISFWLLAFGIPLILAAAIGPSYFFKMNAQKRIEEQRSAALKLHPKIADVSVLINQSIEREEKLIESSTIRAAQSTNRSSSATAKPNKNSGPRNVVADQEVLPVASVVSIDDFVKDIQNSNFKEALQTYSKLQPDEANSKTALLYKLKALVGAGNKDALSEFLNDNEIPDQEFYYWKARVLYEKKMYNQSLEMLSKCTTVPTQLSSRDIMENEILYYRALCYTGKFDQEGTAESQKTALDSWYNTKSAFQANRTHPYYLKANEYIRRLVK